MVTRKTTVHWAAKKIVRLESPRARLGHVLSTERGASSWRLHRMLHCRKAEQCSTETGGNTTQEKLVHPTDFTNRLPEVRRNLKETQHLQVLEGMSPGFKIAF